MSLIGTTRSRGILTWRASPFRWGHFLESAASVLALGDTARYCRMRATLSELLRFIFQKLGCVSQHWNEHHDKQSDDRIGLRSDFLGRYNDECICSKNHSTNTKADVRDGNGRHSELGEANHTGLRTAWWPSWPSPWITSWPSVSPEAATPLSERHQTLRREQPESLHSREHASSLRKYQLQAATRA